MSIIPMVQVMASSELKGEPYGELGAMTGTPVLAPWHKGLNVLFR